MTGDDFAYLMLGLMLFGSGVIQMTQRVHDHNAYGKTEGIVTSIIVACLQIAFGAYCLVAVIVKASL